MILVALIESGIIKYMDLLILSQTTFFFVASFFLVFFGFLFFIMVYHLICISRRLSRISKNLSDISKETKEAIEEIVKVLVGLPLLSFFLKRKTKKGRK